jgi:hypothetical protein
MNPDVSLEFWAEAVALLERIHGPRETDSRDLYMLQQWAACLERTWQRLPCGLDADQLERDDGAVLHAVR